jgi:hypothetical protein
MSRKRVVVLGCLFIISYLGQLIMIFNRNSIILFIYIHTSIILFIHMDLIVLCNCIVDHLKPKGNPW